MEASRPHAVILSSPGIGHRVPVLELAKRLAADHLLHVTLFLAKTQAAVDQEAHLLGLPDSPSTNNLVDIVALPPVDISGLVDAHAAVVTRLAVIMRESCPAFRSSVVALKPKPTVLVVDFFGTDALKIADELGVSRKYVYFPTSAWFSAIICHLQILDKEVKGEYVDQKEPIRLPGCKPVRPEDVVEPMLDRTDQQYHEVVRISVNISTSGADGILVNTWRDLEPTALRAMMAEEGILTRFPVYAIGPLTKQIGPPGSRSEVLDWLDLQPEESVMYVAFGSGGTLSGRQMEELAWGLELSGQKFIWVVRPPKERDSSGNFFTVGGSRNRGPSGYLPEEFLGRTREVGLVVELWASQREILGHPSVGGFMSHCGWNSTLESITSGVPMVAWPLYAEQRMNARLLTEELGVAAMPAVAPSGTVVKREEIGKLVRKVMVEEDGKAMRGRVKKLEESAKKAVRKGGSSFNSLCEVVNGWRVVSDASNPSNGTSAMYHVGH